MKIQRIPLFTLIHDKFQGHKKPFPSLHIRDAFIASYLG